MILLIHGLLQMNLEQILTNLQILQICVLVQAGNLLNLIYIYKKMWYHIQGNNQDSSRIVQKMNPNFELTFLVNNP